MRVTKTARIEVNEHGVGRMFGNVYLRIAKPGVPTRLFSDETEAAEWLNGYRR